MATTNFIISNSRNALTTERRFTDDTSIGVLKGKLELLTGIMMQEMRLEVYDKNEQKLATLEDDNVYLGSLKFADGVRLHVIDITNKVINMEEELSRVKKFEISDEDYAKREGTVRQFKEKMKIGNFDVEKQRIAEDREAAERELAAAIKVGDRCEVTVEGQPTRRAAVAYVGVVDFKPGQYWIGVRYDEPCGKNNGTVQGKSYFSCPDKYGGFIRPSVVKVGDFPPLDDFELDEI